MMRKQYYVYIMTNRSRGLYIGVTNHLARRVFQHKSGESEFTARYKVDTLVHYEVFADVREAIAREKQMKGWDRAKKIELIEESNPNWDELPCG